MSNTWNFICNENDVRPSSGVPALVGGEQVAIFRVRSDFYAVGNYDPFSKAYVMSRGIVGDSGGVVKVVSPIYKQSFNLVTGECLDDPSVKLSVYPVRVEDGKVYISFENKEEEKYSETQRIHA